jgi:hypothetical protein
MHAGRQAPHIIAVYVAGEMDAARVPAAPYDTLQRTHQHHPSSRCQLCSDYCTMNIKLEVLQAGLYPR